MNPFMMQMFNPIGMMPFMGGMGFMMPMCGCSNFMMSMPFSQDDNLWFMNSPIYRDTRYDYLLDPNLALQQCQMNWQNGNIFGNTMLPGFTFPGFAQIPGMPGMPTMPGLNQQPATKTEEEKEAEKKKEEEAKKPAAQKAQKMNEIFDKIKKLAEDKDNNFPEIPEELAKKAEEAMKKETAAEQLAGMKEVFDAIPVDTLRKAILADDIIRNQLRKAGYNFNLAGNKYSLKNKDINKNDIDHADRLDKVHSDIANKNYNELQVLCGQLADTNVAKARILGVISTWNDKYKGSESGILRFIGANLPTGNDAVAKLGAVKEDVKIFTLALLAKANEYEGYDKISKAREEVSKKLTFLEQNDFNQANINSLAAACDTLYARLRMQEAVSVRNEINKNFKYINEIKEGVITDNTIIEETQKDLEKEGIAYPKVNELDETPVTEEIIVQTEEEMSDLDEEYADDVNGKVEVLVQQGKLFKIEGKENLYKTKASIDDNRARYFTIVDDKVYEVFKNGNKFIRKENDKEITAKEIGAYDMAVQRSNKLVENNVLMPLNKNTLYPFFKATGADEYYMIKNNNLVHLIDVESIDIKEVDGKRVVSISFKGDGRKDVRVKDLTEEDFEIFKDDEIESIEKHINNQIKEENSEVSSIESMSFESLKDAESYTKRLEISKMITKDEDNETIVFEKVKDMNGYFKSNYNGKIRYYKYDENNKKLVCLTEYINKKDCGGVISIKNGIAYIQTSKGIEKIEIREVLPNNASNDNENEEARIQAYGLAFAKSVSGPDSGNNYPDALRKLNTLVAIMNSKTASSDEKARFVLNFIKGYQENCGWLTAQSKGICKQIVEETGINLGENINEKNSRTRYIAKIAEGAVEMAKVYNYDNDDDIDFLVKVSKGAQTGFILKQPYETTISALAKGVDAIIENIIKCAEKSEVQNS